MTAQKALEILEMFLHKQCDLQRTEFAYSQNEVWEAVKIAQDVLEKQLQEASEQDKTLTLVFGKDGKATILNEDYVIYCADEETFEKVKGAVGKQIPKKPVGDLHSVPHYRCPTCKSAVVVFEKDTRYVFCKWCGQALDWSGTE